MAKEVWTPNEELKKQLVTKAALRVVDLATLNVDPSYQRELNLKQVASIVASFEETALGIPLVGQREDGSLWTVDGQQRIGAIKKMGRRTVRAEVFASHGPEHEASVFKWVNFNRRKLNSVQQFRALLTAHDEAAWAVKECVEECGYHVVTGKNSRNSDLAADQLTCITTLMGIYKRLGVEPIKFALNTVKQVWPGDKLGVHNVMVDGFAIFWNRNKGVIDLDRLIPRLQTETAQKVHYGAGQMTISQNKSGSVADVLEKIYRKRITSRRGS